MKDPRKGRQRPQFFSFNQHGDDFQNSDNDSSADSILTEDDEEP